MHWETGEGRLICEGRTVLSSDQIVLRHQSSSRANGWLAYIPSVATKIKGLGHRRHALLELEDGRRGWFMVVSQTPSLTALRSCGRFS
ncbi:hypothetical protein [Aquisalimonas sp.]|uniref:hypothetical protein n=1 Tax=unclassified Aquisalimonas TaxID=2644645 RepID=UPI0025C05D86|nr:hypothetical protein [Aquisalimonas sp.]